MLRRARRQRMKCPLKSQKFYRHIKKTLMVTNQDLHRWANTQTTRHTHTHTHTHTLSLTHTLSHTSSPQNNSILILTVRLNLYFFFFKGTSLSLAIAFLMISVLSKILNTQWKQLSTENGTFFNSHLNSQVFLHSDFNKLE